MSNVFTMLLLLSVSLSLLLLSPVGASEPRQAEVRKGLPTVLWHGMGDTCCFSFSMGRIGEIIKNQTGNYVYSIRVGNNIEEDEINGFLMNMNDQVTYVCNLLKKDPKLKDGYNAVGFSQGSQLLRALQQRCDGPKMQNLISVGGQHQGVYGLPNCSAQNHYLCELMREWLEIGAYEYYIQQNLVQAEYWHDPLLEDDYLKYNIFLPDVNNALPTKNPKYKENMLALSNFVMVKFLNDTIVQPRESEWFEFYKPGQDKEILPLKESKLYTEDWIGLKALDESGRLHFLSTMGNHLQMSNEFFIANIVLPYLQ